MIAADVAVLSLLLLGVSGCCEQPKFAEAKPSQAPQKPTAELKLDLKPGFYDADDPNWNVLQDFVAQADIHFDISWHDGISFRDRSSMSLAEVRKLVDNLPRKRLAAVMLQKNYAHPTHHIELKALLKDVGFQAVIITRAGGSFAGLVDFTNFSEASAADEN